MSSSLPVQEKGSVRADLREAFIVFGLQPGTYQITGSTEDNDDGVLLELNGAVDSQMLAIALLCEAILRLWAFLYDHRSLRIGPLGLGKLMG